MAIERRGLMNKNIARKAFDLIVWLGCVGYGDEVCAAIKCCRPKTKFIFTSVSFSDGTIIKGDLIMAKKEFGFSSTLVAVPVGATGADYEHGSEKWDVAASDKDGNDRSSDYTLTPDSSDPAKLKCGVQHSGTTESTALVTLRADGDPDADEEAPITGTFTYVVDSPNVTAFELSEEAPAGGQDAGGGDTGTVV